ncbi:MAG: DegT/DnrJ/EryC1/StrS family aminotransferase [Candidatus Pacebacteria bacterium]|nr:DegT/DnrJ/EryC1/StrS family aminotransferase [Candidatus Paceibacterota bacterium]
MSNKKQKAIFISLSPNVEEDDLRLAESLFFSKNNCRKESLDILKDKMREITGIPNCFLFNSGRSAFYIILKSLNYSLGDEIIVPGFTCNVLINPIISLGLKPVYVDINEDTLNLDLKDLREKITSNTRAIVIQHTFGLPDNILEISKICKENNIDLIEDCAHSLGAKSIGSFSKASFFSFGRDKIVSCVYGGVLMTNDDTLAEKIAEMYEKLPECSWIWVKQQLLHPILTEKLIKPLYGLKGFGKYILIILQKLHIISKAVSDKEKKGKFDKEFVKKMSVSLSLLSLNQLEKLEKLNNHRRKIAGIYYQELGGIAGLTLDDPDRVFMRFPLILEKETDNILSVLRKKKIFLDDGWRKRNIVPQDTDYSKIGYVKGTCPKAEYVAKHIINLPTSINIGLEDAKKISSELKKLI